MKNKILKSLGIVLFVTFNIFSYQIKQNLKSNYLSVSIFELTELAAKAFNGGESIGGNCITDDPGECVAEAPNCNVFCVGNSGNCTASRAWINCGEGEMWCDYR